ncbi:MAG: GTP cyclohydrolase II [Rubrivivax sp.]
MIPPPPAAAVDAPATAATVRVDRARLELRHGRAIALRAAESGPWQLVAAIETLDAQRLQEFRSLGLPLRLLLTAERLNALRDDVAALQPMALALPNDVTLAQLQSLAALASDDDATPPLHGALPADAAHHAALALAKRARLAPALLLAELPRQGGGEWQRWLDDAQLLRLSAADLVNATQPGSALRRVSDAHVPIEAAENCQVVLYREVEGDCEHLAIIVGQPALDRPVPVRLHSACLTGDLLGSLRCDCGEQLRGAAERLAVDGGVLLYLAQEGRGTGLASKLRAYRLQDAGLDTLQADRYLGFRADERDFQAAAAMLHDLGIQRIRLLTNNPHKIDALRRAGIEVVDRLPSNVPVNGHNQRYMQTKQDLAGHWRADDRTA